VGRWIAALLAGLLAVAGCWAATCDERAGLFAPPQEQVAFTPTQLDALAPEMQEWARSHARAPGAYVRSQGSDTYLLVTAGPKPNSGYRIAISKVTSTGQGLEVTVREEHPAPGQPTGAMITFPMALARLETTNAPGVPVNLRVVVGGGAAQQDGP
jgi:hypothetical protein